MIIQMLIVNPNNRLKTELAAVEPPLWAGLIASYHNADILVAEALRALKPNVFCRGTDKTIEDMPVAEKRVCKEKE